MPYITTKALTAPKSTSLAVGTFYFRVPYDRDAIDRTLVTFPDRLRIGTDGKIPPTLFTAGPYTVVREIKGGTGGLSPQPFVVPADPPATSSSPGAVSVTVNGTAVLAWDIYYLTDQNVTYPAPVVGAAQAARDVAITKAAEAAASAASVPSDVGAQLAARPTKATADATYAPLAAALMDAAASPDAMAVGTITRSANGAATGFSVVWAADGATGTFVGTESTTTPGAIDSYTVTHVLAGVTKTYTQPALTRDAATGAVMARPAMTVS